MRGGESRSSSNLSTMQNSGGLYGVLRSLAVPLWSRGRKDTRPRKEEAIKFVAFGKDNGIDGHEVAQHPGTGCKEDCGGLIWDSWIEGPSFQ
jgi:hypothetical protein